MKPRGKTEQESRVSVLSFAGLITKCTVLEDHRGTLRRPPRRNACSWLTPIEDSLTFLPDRAHARLLMKISTDVSIIRGHFWIGLDDRLLSGWGHEEKTTNEERRGQKMTFADLGRFPLIALSTCDLCSASQGEGHPGGTTPGEKNVDNISEP